MSHGFRSYVNRVGYSTVSLPPAPQCAASVSSGSSSSSSESWQLSTVNGLVLLGFITHRIHGAAIYGNIYHQYTPNVSIYTSTMDPSWVMFYVDVAPFRIWGFSLQQPTKARRIVPTPDGRSVDHQIWQVQPINIYPCEKSTKTCLRSYSCSIWKTRLFKVQLQILIALQKYAE